MATILLMILAAPSDFKSISLNDLETWLRYKLIIMMLCIVNCSFIWAAFAYTRTNMCAQL